MTRKLYAPTVSFRARLQSFLHPLPCSVLSLPFDISSLTPQFLKKGVRRIPRVKTKVIFKNPKWNWCTAASVLVDAAPVRGTKLQCEECRNQRCDVQQSCAVCYVALILWYNSFYWSSPSPRPQHKLYSLMSLTWFKGLSLTLSVAKDIFLPP